MIRRAGSNRTKRNGGVTTTILHSFALSLAIVTGCSAEGLSSRSGARTGGGAVQGGAGGTMDPASGGSGGSGAEGGSGGDTGTGGGKIVVPDASADRYAMMDAPACSAIVAENEIIVTTTAIPVDLYFV